MEQLLSDNALQGELASFKATADLLASQRLRFSPSYTPPAEERPRRATVVNVPVCEPPSTSSSADADTPANDALTLTIKSLKPPLTFTLAARPTATIADLKAQLSAAESAAPPPDAQRWILKGKAMGDGKLLKEFPVEEGSTINLMVTKSSSPAPAAAPPAASNAPSSAVPTPSSPSVPSLTLSEPQASNSADAPQLSLQTDLDHLPLSTSTTADNPALVGQSNAFLAAVASPELWAEVRSVCERRFESGAEAQKVWEAMFSGARDFIPPNQKALVREQVGYSAMGGV
ncbi:hypothetical protein JCM10207_008961 [Rhodosporidiobolus poonsookiae]